MGGWSKHLRCGFTMLFSSSSLLLSTWINGFDSVFSTSNSLSRNEAGFAFKTVVVRSACLLLTMYLKVGADSVTKWKRIWVWNYFSQIGLVDRLGKPSVVCLYNPGVCHRTVRRTNHELQLLAADFCGKVGNVSCSCIVFLPIEW